MTGGTRRTLDTILHAMLDTFPSQGRDLGLRAYEGRVDDLSPGGLAKRAGERRRHLATLAALPGGEQEAADRDHLALVLAEEELLLARREQARRDPLWAGRVLGVTSYLEGPAATVAERADGLRRHLEQVPEALDGLAAGLEEAPGAFREAAADVFSGYASFYRAETAAMAGTGVAERAAAGPLGAGRLRRAAAGPHRHRPRPGRAAGQGTGRSRPAAGRPAGGGRPGRRHPGRGQGAGGQARPGRRRAAGRGRGRGGRVPPVRGRQRLHVPARRRAARGRGRPLYLRGALAFHHAPGPFDPVPPASFRYYLTPPLPEWDAERTGRWLALFEPQILAVCSLHETYPGHHAHELHLRRAPTRVARALWNEILGEGWAHYCEEAAFDAGFRAGDPEAEVAMRTDALVRVARLLCAVGMHTQGMTLDEATAEFETTAGLDPDHARLEAVRGTWDPGYFAYTLGKLEILALRDRVGGDLRRFHDRLLANGTPPPAIAARHLLPD